MKVTSVFVLCCCIQSVIAGNIVVYKFKKSFLKQVLQEKHMVFLYILFSEYMEHYSKG